MKTRNYVIGTPHVPSRLARIKFANLWRDAQRRKDVARMEELLQPRWVPLWWWSYFLDADGQWASTCRACIELSLQRQGILPTPAPRPSERAMAQAVAERPDLFPPIKPQPIKPFPLP